MVATEQRIRNRSNWYWLVVKQMCAPKPTSVRRNSRHITPKNICVGVRAQKRAPDKVVGCIYIVAKQMSAGGVEVGGREGGGGCTLFWRSRKASK